MITAAGMGLIAGGAAVGLLTMLLWRRRPAAVSVALAAITGATVAAGGLLLTEAPGPGDWILAIGALSVLAPVHLWGLFGPPGVHEAA
jgi:hypothetical protein